MQQHTKKQLHQMAQDSPWFMFTIEEIAALCNVSRDVVSKVRAASDSPFCLNKCRPEWFADWMRRHPEFQLTKGSSVMEGGSLESCMEFGFRAKVSRPRKTSSRQLTVRKS